MMKGLSTLWQPSGMLVIGLFFICNFANAGTESATKELRDPFWPVGYVPEGWGKPAADDHGEESGDASVEVSNGSAWDEALAKLEIAGVSRKDDKRVVIVNGRVIRVGSSLSVEYAGSRYVWRLEAVDAKGALKLKRLGVYPLSKASNN